MRSICMAAVLLSLLACRSSEEAATPPGVGGMLRAMKAGHEVLAAAARGSFCPSDSTLALVAVGSDWIAALSLRTPWPPPAADTLDIATEDGGQGTARVALRQVMHDVGMALVGVHGTVLIGPDSMASGTFEFMAPTSPGAPDSVRVTGGFTAVPVAPDLCSAP